MAGQNLTRTTRPGTALKRTGVALIAAGMMFFALAPMAQYWPTTWPGYDDYLEAVLYGATFCHSPYWHSVVFCSGADVNMQLKHTLKTSSLPPKHTCCTYETLEPIAHLRE